MSIFLSSCASARNNPSKTNRPLISINKTNIKKSVYKEFLQDEKAATVSYFHQKYNAEYSENFWNKHYGKQVPRKYAQKKAVNKLKRLIVEDQILYKNKIIKDPLAEFTTSSGKKKSGAKLDSINTINKSHREKMIKLENQYKKSKENDVSMRALKQFYVDNKDYWKKPPQKSYGVLLLNKETAMNSVYFQDFLNQKNSQTLPLLTIKKDLENNGIATTYETHDSTSQKNDPKNKYLANTDSQQSETTNKNFLSWPSKQQLAIVRINKITPGGYYSFSSSKNSVRSLYLEKQLRKQVNKKIKSAKVVVNKKEIRKIKIE